jgi:hypothetical protein
VVRLGRCEGLDGGLVFAQMPPASTCPSGAPTSFGGRARNRLFLVARTSLYAL